MNLLKVAQYRILRHIGSGGSASVYLAEDTKLKRKVALKILHSHLTQSAEQVRRFYEEGQWASLVNHPNIVTIFDFGEEDGVHYVATEFVDGETLRDRLQRGPMLLDEVIDVAVSVARALAAAHESWIVHGDIKPENIMLRRDGWVKILDFGIARLAPPLSAVLSAGEGDRRYVTGTLRYLSPEQVRGDLFDSRSDLYSLGVVLYEMSCGQPPFEALSVVDLLAMIVEQEPPPLSPHLPASLQAIISKLIRKNVHERYQTAADLAVELTDLQREWQIRSDRQSKRLPEPLP